MSGLNGLARLVLRLTNWIAGRDRTDWTLAMAAETDAADSHGVRWALGSLCAAVKDRFSYDYWFIAAIIVMPALAIVLVVTCAMMIFMGARTIGVSGIAGIPIMLLTPAPVAWLLGRMRPGYSPIAVGTIAFAVHQTGPLISMRALFGHLPRFWSPNMTYYNMPMYTGLLVSWLVWVAATWWGSSTSQTLAV